MLCEYVVLVIVEYLMLCGLYNGWLGLLVWVFGWIVGCWLRCFWCEWTWICSGLMLLDVVIYIYLYYLFCSRYNMFCCEFIDYCGFINGVDCLWLFSLGIVSLALQAYSDWYGILYYLICFACFYGLGFSCCFIGCVLVVIWYWFVIIMRYCAVLFWCLGLGDWRFVFLIVLVSLLCYLIFIIVFVILFVLGNF